jgi:hypothetical protein
MKTSIRVIKRGSIETIGQDSAVDLRPSDSKTNTREMVSTVKSWITEMQLRKRTQIHSFTVLTAAASVRK